MRLILASTSRYRRELLSRLKLPFECVAPQVEESQQADESVEQMTLRLAAAKAQAVAERHPEAWVIGSDQSASLDGVALGKPGTEQRAAEQLLSCSGREVRFHTAVALVQLGQTPQMELDATVVHFRALTQAEVKRYVQAEQPLDCAGSFKCEGLGISLFESIENEDPTALTGLPLIALSRMLRAANFLLP